MTTRRRRDPEKVRQYSRGHYVRNRARMIARSAAAKPAQLRAVQAAILAYLVEHPCADCGEADPVVLEFDHREGKEFSIGEVARRGYGISRVMAEIEKCDVRCANCHRRKTYAERGLSHRSPAAG